MNKRVVVPVVLACLAASCGGDDDAADDAADDSAVSETSDAAGSSGTDPSADESVEASGGDEIAESSDAESSSDDASSTDTAAGLADVCPSPLVIQTDWFPSPEHAYAYSLIENGALDAESGVYRGPLLDTGIDLEIRAGGPYLGYQPSSSTMYVDDGIHLGYVSTDEAVSGAAGDLPTIAVVAPLEINPQILMWNPEQYDFASFEEIGESDATVLYFAGATYVDYMVGAGILNADQVDPSYDGSPARFVAEDGAVAQQGFATSEPYFYENELAEWMQPVDYLLVHDSGFEVYSQPLVVRPDQLETLRPCLEQVVPMFQQAVVDHIADPAETNQEILDIVEELASSWVLYPGQMEYSVETSVELGVVGNGPDDIVGNFDEARMDEVVALLKDVLDDVPDDLEASQLYTNEFIDPTIGF